MRDDSAGSDTLILGRYRVEETLGEGGLGTVVKAFDTRLKRFVAIKTLKRSATLRDPDTVRNIEERFAREAEAGSRMGSHPNLVSVYDLSIDAEGTHYLVLEYVPGGTLGDRIARGALPLAEALNITVGIAQGLQAAHEHGLVHRDIKPTNIFLTPQGQPKVGDFGIAQIDDVSGRTRAATGHPGTPLYMSPEQERLTAYVRPASDQYSLGLVLFEMLTRRIYKRVGERQAAALLAAQPAPVRAIIERMLAPDPDDRYPALADVIAAIQAMAWQIAGAETIPVHPAAGDGATLLDTPYAMPHPTPPITPHAAPTAVPPRRHSRRAVLLGGGGFLLAAGTAGVAAVGLRGRGAPVATGTPPTTVIAAVPTLTPVPPTVAAPTATGVPTATTGVPTATPIVATATPVAITATPPPTAITLPTLLNPPTQPAARTATATALRAPFVTAPEVGLAASVLETPTAVTLETDGNIITKLFTFNRAYLRLHLFRGETGSDTTGGWARVQRYILNVPTSSKVAAAVADGRSGYSGDVAGICDTAETKCLPCSFTAQGVVCPQNTGLVRPINWYHVILATQAPGGIIVADYFCDLAKRSSRDCLNDAQTILPSMRVIGPPASG